MSEDKAQYTVHPDIAVRLEVSEKHIKQLESTIDGMTMVMGRHADTITEQKRRIAELEATVLRQSETIARLEADNRRLRHLDAMPVDAMRADAVSCEVYTDDLITVCDWFEKLDGDA